MHRQQQAFWCGVTGSGKQRLHEGSGGCTVPGQDRTGAVIHFTPQTVSRFKGLLGSGSNSSRLSLGERYDEWRRIRRNDVQIVVGARSAVLHPGALGLVIIDEHTKTAINPRYAPLSYPGCCQRCELTALYWFSAAQRPAWKITTRQLKGNISYGN